MRKNPTAYRIIKKMKKNSKLSFSICGTRRINLYTKKEQLQMIESFYKNLLTKSKDLIK